MTYNVFGGTLSLNQSVIEQKLLIDKNTYSSTFSIYFIISLSWLCP